MATLLYEGKAKKIFAGANPYEVIIHYKDDATAGNGAKKTEFADKGILNAEITTLIFTYLQKKGIKTHFLEQVNARELRCEKIEIILLEVIARNIATGSLTKRIGIPEGTVFESPIYEICYKADNFHDPLINDSHALALGLATKEELAVIYQEVAKINDLLTQLFDSIGITLVDFKLEFGRNQEGKVVLADEISPDTCRFWDKETGEKLDKDRFRQDLGDVMGAYREILHRLKVKLL